jgi:hypothetical protein
MCIICISFFFFYISILIRPCVLTFCLSNARQLVQSILDQSHLAPFTTHIQPIVAEYDHAMRLYPLPTCVSIALPGAFSFSKTFIKRPIGTGMQVVLADKYDSYRMTYEGCHVFNPGRFIGRSLGFSTYTPATRESEAWYVFLLISHSSPDNCGGRSLHFPQHRGFGSRELTTRVLLLSEVEGQISVLESGCTSSVT